jgi:ferrous iron transport protein B
MRPIGFDWKTSTAMIGAFAAKEIFVAQLGIVHSIGEEADEDSEPLRDKLRSEYTKLQAVSILLFCLISAPCMVTIAATRRESGSWKWALFQLAGLTLLAWIVSFAVYQGGLMAGFGP